MMPAIAPPPDILMISDRQDRLEHDTCSFGIAHAFDTCRKGLYYILRTTAAVGLTG